MPFFLHICFYSVDLAECELNQSSKEHFVCVAEGLIVSCHLTVLFPPHPALILEILQKLSDFIKLADFSLI